MTLKVSH